MSGFDGASGTGSAGQSRAAVVIGAGIVGVATALYLQRDGWQVTIVDREPPGKSGASFGNAGLIAGHIIQPLAVRSILSKIPKMLLDQTAPLAIRWRHFPALLPWLIRLLKATHPAEVERISAALASELKFADDAYKPLLADAGGEDLVRRKGVVVVYRDQAGLAEVEPVLDLQRRNGVPFDIVGDNALRNLMPGLSRDYRYGVHYTASGHVLDPYRVVTTLAAHFETLGGRWCKGHATGFRTLGGRVTAVETEAGTEACDMVVVAAGAWSKPLAAKLGSRVPLDTERGYHVMVEDPGIPGDVPAIMGDVRFAVTPMAAGLRLAGTIEFAGLKAPPNPRRHEALIAHAKNCFPELRTEKHTRWMGHRPSLPDSMPVIGGSPVYTNAFFGFGHGHLGLTSAAITGRTIADLAAGRTPLFDPTPFRVDRF